MDDVLAKIAQYGYGGLFVALVLGIVGLPIPDETILVFCGYLVSRGTMQFLLTWSTALAGSICGISFSYFLGRSAGYEFVHRWGKYIHLTEDRLTRVQNWFDRVGHWLLTIGYYVPGVRHFTALVAGMSGMKYRSFATYAYPGALLWVSTFLSLGYFLGERWREVFDALHRDILIGIMGLTFGAWLVWIVVTRYRDRRRR